MRVADISSSRLTDAAVDALLAAGVEKMIVGVREDNHALTLHNLEMAQRFPNAPDLYTYLCWSGDPAGRVQYNIERYDGLYDRHWLDCEDNGYGVATLPNAQEFLPEMIVGQVDEAMAVCRAAGVPYGYYSGPWWHPTATGNYSGWAEVPLWTAEYGDEPADLTGWTQYGDWQELRGWQYQADVTIGGVVVDLNVFRPEAI